MHEKNPFIKDYDFDLLIQEYSLLKDFVFINQYGNQTIKFADEKAVKALNSALLKVHYGIVWDIPKNNLCPPIPGRLDYLLYIADLVDKENICLLDIGTGANLIYPILATCHLNWKCVASEVEMSSLKNAQKIIDDNSILKTIELRHQKNKNHILNQVIQKKDVFDVVVCNPPFHKSQGDAKKRNQRKVKNLKLEGENTLNFGGRSNELWYKGGEEAFVKKMIEESVVFKNQVDWFTSLISKKDNLKHIKRAIRKISPSEFKIVEMGQGNKKSRFVAWTFQ